MCPTPLEQGVADIVGVLAALGLLSGEGFGARLALDQAAEQVGAGAAPAVSLPLCPASIPALKEPERCGAEDHGVRQYHEERLEGVRLHRDSQRLGGCGLVLVHPVIHVLGDECFSDFLEPACDPEDG